MNKIQTNFFNKGTTQTYEWRIAQLYKLEKMLQDWLPKYEEAVRLDFGKSAFDLYTTEIGLLHKEIKWFKQHLKKLMQPKKVKGNLLNFPSRSFLLPSSIGPSLVIGAWNYPFLLVLGPSLAALAAGNPVTIKPSEITRYSSNILAESIQSVFPVECVQVIEGGKEVTQQLLSLKWAKIFFTGSTNIGKIVYKAAAENITPVTLELGGKNPVIIDKTGLKKNMFKRIVWSKFLNAGQTCVSPDYALVDEKILADFVRGIEEEIARQELKVVHQNYTQIVNEAHFHRLINLLASFPEAQDKIDEKHRTIYPIILTSAKITDKLMQEEIFGPILPVFTYKNEEEIWEQLLKHPTPLSAYIFSEDKKLIQKFKQNVLCGSIGVNDAIMQLSNFNLPFGGIGSSGMGSYHGKYGFDTFTHYKALLEKGLKWELDLKYGIKTEGKIKWIKRLLR